MDKKRISKLTASLLEIKTQPYPIKLAFARKRMATDDRILSHDKSYQIPGP